MLAFVREDQLAAEFKRISKGADEIRIAVPFWGDGATDLLGLRRSSRSLRILCNLQSAACNPYAVEKLINLGAHVRTHPRLHAKLYAAGRFVIIGSSNASRNGITNSGEVIRGSLEANIITDDPAIVASSRDLFEEIWNSEETSRVSKAALTRAKEVWKPLPALQSGKSLLAAAAKDRALRERLYVAVYSDPLSPAATQKLKEVQSRAVSNLDATGFRNAWGYQFSDPIPAGAWVIDVSCKRVTVVNGCARIPAPILKLQVPGENDLTIAVREVVSVGGTRLKLSADEKQHLIAVAPKVLNSRSTMFPMPVARVLRMLK